MKNLKKVIIFLSIFIIIIFIFLMLLLKRGKSVEPETNIEEPQLTVEEVLVKENIINKVTSKLQYFNIKNCVEKYRQFCLNLNYAKNLKDEYKIQVMTAQLKSLIPDFVIKDLNITDNNIIEQAGIPNSIMQIDSIYESRQTINKQAYINNTNIIAYIIKGILINENNIAQQKDFNLILIIDNVNYRFLIIPQSYIEKKNIDVSEGKSLKIYEKEIIEDNEYNGYTPTDAKEEDMAIEYFNLCRYFIDYDIDYLYKKMDETYRTARFGDIEQYRSYIKANYNELISAKAEKYMVNYLEDGTQYVIQDQYQNLYIFNAKNPLDFTVELDTYTHFTEKFISTYDNAETYKKVQMNIDKFFQMINRHDYRTSFSKLADSFKSTSNMATEDDFAKVANQTFFSHNKVEYVKFKEVGSNTYMYQIKLTDLMGQEEGERNITVIMQLNENREYVMSFSAN